MSYKARAADNCRKRCPVNADFTKALRLVNSTLNFSGPHFSVLSSIQNFTFQVRQRAVSQRPSPWPPVARSRPKTLEDHVTFNSSLSPGPAVLLGHELISRPGLHSPCKSKQNRVKRYSEQRCEFRDDVSAILDLFWARISRSFTSEHRVYTKASCFNKLLLWR